MNKRFKEVESTQNYKGISKCLFVILSGNSHRFMPNWRDALQCDIVAYMNALF